MAVQKNGVRSHLVCALLDCRPEPHWCTWSRARRHCSPASHLFSSHRPDCTEYRKTRFFSVPQTCFLYRTYRFRGFWVVALCYHRYKRPYFSWTVSFQGDVCLQKNKTKGLVLLRRGLSNTMTKIAWVRWNSRVLSCVCCMISVSDAASSHPVLSPHSACCFLLRQLSLQML